MTFYQLSPSPLSFFSKLISSKVAADRKRDEYRTSVHRKSLHFSFRFTWQGFFVLCIGFLFLKSVHFCVRWLRCVLALRCFLSLYGGTTMEASEFPSSGIAHLHTYAKLSTALFHIYSQSLTLSHSVVSLSFATLLKISFSLSLSLSLSHATTITHCLSQPVWLEGWILKFSSTHAYTKKTEPIKMIKCVWRPRSDICRAIMA